MSDIKQKKKEIINRQTKTCDVPRIRIESLNNINFNGSFPFPYINIRQNPLTWLYFHSKNISMEKIENRKNITLFPSFLASTNVYSLLLFFSFLLCLSISVSLIFSFSLHSFMLVLVELNKKSIFAFNSDYLTTSKWH